VLKKNCLCLAATLKRTSNVIVQIPGLQQKMDPTLNPLEYAQYGLVPRCSAFKLIAKNYDLIAKLPPGSRAIDVGCGTGEATLLLQYFSNLKEIFGLDFSQPMLDVAREKTQDPRVKFCKGNMENSLEYPTGKFDLITANAVLMFSNDQVKLLNTLSDKLESGSYLMASMVWAGAVGSPIYDLSKFIINCKWASKFDQSALRMPKTLIGNPWVTLNEDKGAFYQREYLDKTDLTVIECKCESMKTYFTENMLKGQTAVLAAPAAHDHVSDVEFEEYLNAAYDVFKAACEKVGDMFCVNTEMITFVAKK